jgi:LPS export ABC transporter protein LptC
MLTNFYQIKITVIFFISIIILISCENEMSSIHKISFDSSAPDETTKKLHVVYSDSGFARVEIIASSSETYTDKRNITKMHDSLRVNFFSSEGKIISTLSALYGEIDHTKGIIIVRDSVRLRNLIKNQTLETEELTWNQKDSLIYSISQVIIKTPRGIVIGSGIRTKQDFDSYEILNPSGSIKLEKELNIE